MSILLIAVAILMGGILLPIGIVLGVSLGIKLLLWKLDKALADDDDATPPSK